MQLLKVVLSTEDIEKTKRAIASCDGDCLLIVNTLNEDYIAEVENAELDCAYMVTPSNGTPGAGKQSVIDYFLNQSFYTHLTYVDADDFYLPGAFNRIEKHLEGFDYVGTITDCFTPQRKLISMVDWQNPRNLRKEFHKNDLEQFKKFCKVMRHLIDNYTPEVIINRIVGLSKAGAEQVKFCSKLNGFDDVKVQIQLASECAIGTIAGKIVYDNDIYLYDRSDGGGTLTKFVDNFTAEQQEIFWEGLRTDPFTDEIAYVDVLDNMTREERLKIVEAYAI
tara:strand:- start:3498 stop:4334 length:837 start_codon:yes stop_codon:yes gene_type:complete